MESKVPEENRTIFAISVTPDEKMMITLNTTAMEGVKLLAQVMEDLRVRAIRETLEARQIQPAHGFRPLATPPNGGRRR